MTLAINKKDTYFVTLLSFIFICLDLSYVDVIEPYFNYMGFKQKNISLLIQSCCYLLSIILSFLVFKLSKQILDRVFLLFILLFLTFPSIILFKNGGSTLNIVISQVLFILFIGCLISFDIKFRLPRLKIKGVNSGNILLFTVLIGSTPFLLTYKFNVDFQNLLLENIYETRAAQKEGSNILTAYLYSPMSKIVIPFGLIYFIDTKKRTPLLIFVILGIYFFLVGAHKAVLFGNLFCVMLYYFNSNYFIDYFLYLILGVILIGASLYFFSGNIFFSSLIIRRAFFLPALLDTFYFEFFKDIKMMYSHSFLEGLITNKLGNSSPAIIVGEKYLNGANANNGLISDGYLNFGYVGIALNFLIVGVFYVFIRSLKLKPIYIGVPFLFFFNILSSAPLTVLLTHGGAFFIIYSFFLNNVKE